MWETEKASQIAENMRRYNLALPLISEAHWTQAGHRRLGPGEELLFLGNQEKVLHIYKGLQWCCPKKHDKHLQDGDLKDPELSVFFKTKNEEAKTYII